MRAFRLSDNSKINRMGIDPRLIHISDLAIKITLVDFGHGNDSGLRSAKRQNELFLDGKSKCDGYDKISRHQEGKALDFYAYVNGASWEHHHLAMVGAAHLEAASRLGYRIRWGGLWKPAKEKLINGIQYGWDMAHIELID